MYWEFWSAFWDQWAQAEAETVPADIAPADAATPIVAAQEDAKYRYLTQYGTQILALFDAAGCTYLSDNFTTQTGQPAPPHMGEAFFELIHADFRQALRGILAGGAVQSFRCQMRHADGQWQWYSFDIQSQESGERVCIVTNINKSILTQNTLQKARIEAELALRARSEFLSNMSHDLRTPLNAIIGFSQIIESGMFGTIENPHYLEYISHIRSSGYELLLKIEDLLEIADIEAGEVRLHREDAHIGDIMKHAVEAQSHHAAAAKVMLETLDSTDDALLHVDRGKMQHILGHLLANAIRFSKEGGCVTLSASLSPQGEVELCVSDGGTGMPQGRLDAIRAALEQEQGWTVGGNRSIGLGLSLTRECVTLHGGRLAFDSAEDMGTNVRITLPKECMRMELLRKTGYLQAVN